jgi:hypothetical protein
MRLLRLSGSQKQDRMFFLQKGFTHRNFLLDALAIFFFVASVG